ncbi:hypothetical protein Sgou_08840 [Streptomyces gougerotii]|uniref:Uncharacterized protein n=2 Tax=Streptomyces diastaticus group TaxID=2849069 RepID=A0A8H9HX13_9ACTN|nr:hypothetical protein Sdia_26120 [Streptomyces diastaticus subsp. diastaticus]GFH76214.1 hypothetical protein Sgou_08840 [Streptomyces gougerotii]GGU41291.1 hypothetical protein GCM10015534_50090 [Streptomyces diastaticus subsp. diastaticus]GGU84303.1 hypothetical protein GCM10010227_43300 [Streptomyces gougerotii]
MGEERELAGDGVFGRLEGDGPVVLGDDPEDVAGDDGADLEGGQGARSQGWLPGQAPTARTARDLRVHDMPRESGAMFSL